MHYILFDTLLVNRFLWALRCVFDRMPARKRYVLTSSEEEGSASSPYCRLDFRYGVKWPLGSRV